MILSLMLCSLTVGGSARLVFDGDSLDLDNYGALFTIMYCLEYCEGMGAAALLAEPPISA